MLFAFDRYGSSSFLWKPEDNKLLFLPNKVDSSIPFLMLTVQQAENLNVVV